MTARLIPLAGASITLDNECPCPVDYNGHQAIEPIQRIKQLATSQQARIWVLHDPEDWAELGSAVHA